MKKRIVVALGHKALGTTLPEQKSAVKRSAEVLADIVEEGYQLVTVSELLGLPEIVCSAEKYVYHRRDTEENIRPDAVPQN